MNYADHNGDRRFLMSNPHHSFLSADIWLETNLCAEECIDPIFLDRCFRNKQLFTSGDRAGTLFVEQWRCAWPLEVKESELSQNSVDTFPETRRTSLIRTCHHDDPVHRHRDSVPCRSLCSNQRQLDDGCSSRCLRSDHNKHRKKSSISKPPLDSDDNKMLCCA